MAKTEDPKTAGKPVDEADLEALRRENELLRLQVENKRLKAELSN